jgi:hypothetical protein
MKQPRGVLQLPQIDTANAALSKADSGSVGYSNGQLVASLDGGPWEALAIGSATILEAADVYIDPATGSDAADGLTPATALATWAEYARRVGVGPVTAVPWQTVHLEGPVTEEIEISAHYSTGLVLQGERTVVYSGTVTAEQAYDYTVTPILESQVEDTALPAGWAAHVGRMVVATSGPNAGSVCWVLADEGADTAFMSNLFDVAAFSGGDWTAGDDFDVVDLTVVSGLVTVKTGDFVDSGFVALVDLDLQGGVQGNGSVIALESCRINAGVTTAHFFAGCYVSASACLWLRTWQIWHACSDAVLWGCAAINPRIGAEVCQISMIGGFSGQRAAGNFAASNAFQASEGALLTWTGGGVGVRGVSGGTPVVFYVLAHGRIHSADSAWTLGQSIGYGVVVQPYGLASWVGDCADFYRFDISGTGVELRLGSADTDAATLGVTGAITAANNAAALPTPVL